MAVTARRLSAFAWHVVALSSCTYGFKSLEVLPELLGVSMEEEYGGFMQFLTMCGLTATAITMVLATIQDIVGTPEALSWIKDLAMAASLPTETMITILYWSIVVINKDLLMQPKKVMDPHNPGQVLREETVSVPFSIDASLHAFPGVFLLVDFFLFSRPLPKSIPIVAVAAAVTVSYALWAGKCAEMNGHYPYPLLDVLSDAQRFTFYSVAGLAACGTGAAVVRLQARFKGRSGSKPKRQ